MEVVNNRQVTPPTAAFAESLLDRTTDPEKVVTGFVPE
jgi:hypothetical protein